MVEFPNPFSPVRMTGRLPSTQLRPLSLHASPLLMLNLASRMLRGELPATHAMIEGKGPLVILKLDCPNAANVSRSSFVGEIARTGTGRDTRRSVKSHKRVANGHLYRVWRAMDTRLRQGMSQASYLDILCIPSPGPNTLTSLTGRPGLSLGSCA